MAGKGGGAWKVAYADFVTAMMAFFMVMWLVSQNQDTKEAVQEYFQNPTVQLLPAWVSRGPHEGGGSSKKHDGEDPSPDEGKGSKKNRPQKRVRAEDVKHARLLMRTDGDQTVVGSVITFDHDSATLQDEAKTELDQLVPLIAGKSNRIELRGHTARRPAIGDSVFADDWQLSFARSVAVMKYLEGAGIEAQRMRLSQAGAYEPPQSKQDDEVDQSRVEVFVLSEFIDNSPGDHKSMHEDPHLDEHEGHEDDHGSAAHHDSHGAAAHSDGHGQGAGHAPAKPAKKPTAKPAHGKAAHGKSGHDKPAHGAAGHGKSAKPAHGKPAAKASSHSAPKKKPAKGGHGGGH